MDIIETVLVETRSPSSSDDIIDQEFRKLFQQIISESSIEEYTDFGRSVDTSELAVNPQNIDWREASREKCIELVLEGKKDGEEHEIEIDDELLEEENLDTKLISRSEALKHLDLVKTFAETKGDENLNMALADVMNQLEQLRLS